MSFPTVTAPQGFRFVRQAKGWVGDHPLSQIGLLIGVAAIFTFLGSNAADNMARLGLTPGFAFLGRPASFEIGESVVAFTSQDSFGWALTVGLLNTMKVAALGCMLATVLGVALGIARLSANPLLSGIVQVYVELVRNTPLLLQLFFWSATLHALPSPRQALQPVTGVFLSNRGLFLPGPENTAAAVALTAAILVAVVAVAAFSVYERRRGGLPWTTRIGALTGAAVGPFVLLWAAGVPLGLQAPQLQGFNFVGGLTVTPEFAVLLIGLVVNTAANIAEIVRGGILSVPRGQWEAARSLGLPVGRVLRLVVLPQALRVIIPMLTSTYLSLTKSSSLAVAIGFPDLVSVVNTSANQTGQVIESLTILVAAYLTLSILVSIAMNAYNRRITLRGGRT
jgi:general L-amino acid transport system permease protein